MSLPSFPIQEIVNRLRKEFPNESELGIRQMAVQGVIATIRDQCNGDYDATLGVMELMAKENPELAVMFNEYGSDA